MMKLNHRLVWIFFLGLILTSFAWASSFIAPECRSLALNEEAYSGPSKYTQGLLWKVSKAGIQSSYIFGTIHVADENILSLPAVVSAALDSCNIFVMETLPDSAQILSFFNMMYFSDGNRLTEMLSKQLFEKTVEILSAYHLPEEAVAVMKPWAAFLIMNYPPNMGTVLDLELLRIAQNNGNEIYGLETLEEQGDVLNGMDYEAQIRLLTDSVCHYNIVIEDFEKMKIFYRNRDLQGLFAYSNRYSISNDAVYEELLEKLLTKRNYIMAERMQPMLKDGNAFIAIGAMHLPGDEGVLHLLMQRHYDISLVY